MLEKKKSETMEPGSGVNTGNITETELGINEEICSQHMKLTSEPDSNQKLKRSPGVPSSQIYVHFALYVLQ